MLVILGSINADLIFKVEHLPLPGETVLCPSYEMAPGGKGANQAAASAKVGAQAFFVGHVGDDAYGPEVRRLLVEAGVDDTHLATADKPTAIAVIGVDKAGENAIIVASGANLQTHAGQASALFNPSVTLLCQNEIRSEETFRAIREASAAGCRTILNLAPAGDVPGDVLDALDYLIVNEHEARAVAGDKTSDIRVVARHLASSHRLAVVLTIGAKGSFTATSEFEHEEPALAVEPVDTTGAGDCFCGILAAKLDAGLEFRDAVRHATIGASLACTAIGAQTSQPTNAEILARL